MIAGFENEQQQKRCREKIRAEGYTVRGWAKARKFSPHTVVNLLCRREGIGEDIGPSKSMIMAALKEEGLA